MSGQVEGLALDEAVAKVLGTYVPKRAFASILYVERSPRYSTDAATLPEMLAHLQKDYGDIQLRWYEGQGWGAYVYFIDDNDQYADEGGQGATLNEAIARLVLALAATASKPEGKACGGEGQ